MFDAFLRDLIGWTTDGALQAKVWRLRDHLAQSPTPHVLLQKTGLWFDGVDLHTMGLPFQVVLWTRVEGEVGRLAHPWPVFRTIAGWKTIVATRDHVYWTGDHFLVLDAVVETLERARVALQDRMGWGLEGTGEDGQAARGRCAARSKRDVTTRMWSVEGTEGKRSKTGSEWKQTTIDRPQGDAGSPPGVENKGDKKRSDLGIGGENSRTTGSARSRGNKKRFLPVGPLPEGPPRDFFRRRSSPGRGDGVKDPGR